METSRRAWTAALACVACGGPQAPATPAQPSLIDVAFRSALIAPTKTGGAPWDGIGPPSPGAASTISKALGMTNPHAAVVEALAAPVMQGLEKPEPFGHVAVRVDGAVREELELTTAERDTLTPLWSNAVARRVPLAQSTVLEVRLLDRDLSEHDAIGDCNIRYEDLAEALQARDVHQVRVAEQTGGQLLFLGISVYPSSQ